MLFFSCATLAKLGGHGFFGVQDFEECWAGELTSEFFENSTKANKCWGVRPNYTECDDNAETKCIGPARYNYIYEIIPGIMKIEISSWEVVTYGIYARVNLFSQNERASATSE